MLQIPKTSYGRLEQNATTAAAPGTPRGCSSPQPNTCRDKFVSAPQSASSPVQKRSTSPAAALAPTKTVLKADVGAAPAMGPKLTDRVEATTIKMDRNQRTEELEFSYTRKDGTRCGPYIVTIKPTPSADKIEVVKQALINLIDLARTENPKFQQVSFSASGKGAQQAAAVIWVPVDQNNPKGKQKRIVLGGGGGLDDQGFVKATNKQGDKYADLIDRNMRFLRSQLHDENDYFSVEVKERLPA
jgi:hypothetical protein